MPTRLELIREGRTEVWVPSASLTARVPETHPVFFNPAARTNRDISVAVARVTKPRTFLDALAGTGVRGVRIAKEAGRPRPRVTLVDFSEESVRVARMNVQANGLQARCDVVRAETNAYLCSRFERPDKFEALDLDPFGTPAPYVQSGLMATADAGLLSTTATDAPVLCGVYPSVCLRRYGALSVRTEFVHETALRVLLGFAARMGGINDIGIEPVLAHSTLHYLRIYLRVLKGATQADQSVRSIGFVTQCNVCRLRWQSPTPAARCECGTKVRSSGPLWTGPLVDEKLVARASRCCEKEGWTEARAILDGLAGSDAFPPFGYSLQSECSRQRVPSVSLERTLESLESLGFGAIKHPFEPGGIKTTAGYADFAGAVRSASRP